MKLARPTASIIAILSLALIIRPAQAADTTPGGNNDASSILKAARMNPAAHPACLRAQIRGEGAPTPLTISLKDHVIRYQFQAPSQTIILKLDPDGMKLLEKTETTTSPLPSSKLHREVRDTGITYQDLSLGFLYWPHPVLQGEETVKTRPAWKIDLQAPSGEPVYGVARVWIDKESGAILRMEGYDKSGLLLRRFEVVSAQKLDGLWMLRQMRIESFAAGNSEPLTRRYLEVLGQE